MRSLTWTYEGTVVYSGFTKDGVHDFKKTDYTAVTRNTALPADYTRAAYTPKDGETPCEPTTWNNGIGAHAIDPCVFYDEEGKLWFVYGSWSGGIYMFALDEETGFRDMSAEAKAGYDNTPAGKYMGKRLGGSGASGEAPYIQYIGDSYYLFISYGGLVANGGYNMRVFRSENPDGPYKDISGNLATQGGDVNGSGGKVGTRLMGYYKWSYWENAQTAQGHNSAFVDDDGNAYVIYHTRTDDGSEYHSVRVHQLFTTKSGYLTAAPFEYRRSDEPADAGSEIAGDYEILFQNNTNHATLEYNKPQKIALTADGKITGALSGTWQKDSEGNVTLKADNVTYEAVFLNQTMEGTNVKTLCFTAAGAREDVDTCLWGFRYPKDEEAVSVAAQKVSLPKRISEDIEFPAEGLCGTKITWESDSPFLLADGSVIQPKGADAAVTLTATITRGAASYTKKIEVTVRAATDGAYRLDSFYSEEPLDLAAGKTETVGNPLRGVDTSSGVTFKFKVKRTGAFAHLDNANIFSLTAGPAGGYTGRLYFTGGSYLGYNATGGIFDANLYNGDYPEGKKWTAGTDFIGVGTEREMEIAFTPGGYSVKMDGEKIYDDTMLDKDRTTVQEGEIPGSSTMKDYSNVLDFLSSADELNFGAGSWWEGTFKGTLRDFEIWVEPVPKKPSGGNAYYSEDYEWGTDVKSIWSENGGATVTEVAADENKYVKLVPSGSGNRGVRASFGLEKQPEGKYTFETDVQLTSSTGNNGSTTPVTQFVLAGKDLSYKINEGAGSGYILNLSASGVNNQTFTINDTNDTVDIPKGTWVHITVSMDSADRTKATLSIVNKSTGQVILTDKEITANGTGELSGVYILLGRGTSSAASLDNTVLSNPEIADYAAFNEALTAAERYVAQNEAESIYSQESMQALSDAVDAANALDKNLSAGQQGQVDECATKLTAAIEGLICANHKYDKGIVTKKATCTEKGLKTRTCCACGKISEEEIPAGHTFGAWKITKVPTDTEAGTRTRTCSVCGESESGEVSLCTTHSYGAAAVTRQATCTTAGTREKVCTECGHTVKTDIAMTAHKYGVWAITEPGKKERVCSVCSHKETKQIETCGEHTYGPVTEVKKPSCTATGKKKETCIICGYFNETEVAKTEHTYGAWEITKAATETAPGERKRTCEDCSDKQTEEVEFCQSHTYGDPVVTDSATCTTAGRQKETCSVCGYIHETEIAVKAHTPGDWETTKAATTGEEGERVRKCKECGTVMETEKIAKLTDTPKTDGNKTPSDDGQGEDAGNVKEDGSSVKENATYTSGNLKYKVTSVSKKTVTVAGVKKKTLTSATVGKTVKIKGTSYKITAIANNAFANCKKLKKVTVGANVQKIGKKAFYKDAKLKTITVKTKKLKSVGKNALKGINKKAKVKVPASCLKKYKKLFKKKGQASSVKIK